MAKRAQSSGIRLTNEDAALVKAMLARGDRQHDIAAWFGVNAGRIANVATEKTHKTIRAATRGLPPEGPYLSSRDAHAAMIALKEAQVTINTAIELIAERQKRA